MNRLFYSVLIGCFIFAGCSSGDTERDRRIVAEVNDYKMSVEDLKDELDNMLYDRDNLATEEDRAEYMDRLLEKEVLLQEAQRQGLDKEEDFMKSIENYWEQTLLKLLLERKSNEISGSIHVYDSEIDEYRKDSTETVFLPRMKADIKRRIRRRKETEAMDAWIDELRKTSYIKIDKDLAKEILSKGGGS